MIESTNAHTFSIVHVVDDAWTGSDTYVATTCQCGIASGEVHSTLEDARLAHVHVCPSTRKRPVWDGMVV